VKVELKIRDCVRRAFSLPVLGGDVRKCISGALRSGSEHRECSQSQSLQATVQCSTSMQVELVALNAWSSRLSLVRMAFSAAAGARKRVGSACNLFMLMPF
jgi:hypothetical protein